LAIDENYDIADITSRASAEPGPSYDEFLKVVSKYPLVNVPYGYPVYSNTGMSLLGLSNIAANKINSSDPSNEPQTHNELVKRDIFDPLQLNSSFYRVPSDEALRAHIAVPLMHSEWADISLGDVVDAAGGQYSSLGDLATFMKTLLSPVGRGGVVPANVVREWLRPLYTWNTGSEEVGAPWEIVTSLSGPKAYTKGDTRG
jgi:CubicO group peptidase (beta-lactamase class C family)